MTLSNVAYTLAVSRDDEDSDNMTSTASSPCTLHVECVDATEMDCEESVCGAGAACGDACDGGSEVPEEEDEDEDEELDLVDDRNDEHNEEAFGR